MARNKSCLTILILCLCFQNVNAELEFFNESDLIEYILNSSDSVKIIDWAEYNTNWSSDLNYHSVIPNDVDHIAFPGPAIKSVYLHPIQKYVKYDRTMHSNTPKPRVITGYSSGVIKFSDFTRSEIIDENNELSCTFSCAWKQKKIVNEKVTWINKFGSREVFIEYYDTAMWGNISKIDISLSNYSGGYLILNITTPKTVTAYTLNVISPNHSAYYERFDYMYSINETESLTYYDMVDVDSMSCSGIIPFGLNRFYLPFDTGYNISITLYTPFEQKTINYTNIYIENNGKIDYEDDMEYIGFCFGFIFAVYYLYRCI